MHRELITAEAVNVPETASGALLLLETPLELRRTLPDSPPDFPSVIASLANRVTGLTRWQDAELDLDAGLLIRLARELDVRWSQGARASWERYSSRQGRSIPMEGRYGSILVEGGLGPLQPLLALGETCHVGSHATLGLGRYRLIFLP